MITKSKLELYKKLRDKFKNDRERMTVYELSTYHDLDYELQCEQDDFEQAMREAGDR